MGEKKRRMGKGYSQYINNMGVLWLITRFCLWRKLTVPNDYFPQSSRHFFLTLSAHNKDMNEISILFRYNLVILETRPLRSEWSISPLPFYNHSTRELQRLERKGTDQYYPVESCWPQRGRKSSSVQKSGNSEGFPSSHESQLLLPRSPRKKILLYPYRWREGFSMPPNSPENYPRERAGGGGVVVGASPPPASFK